MKLVFIEKKVYGCSGEENYIWWIYKVGKN